MKFATNESTSRSQMTDLEFMISFECMETVMDSIDAGEFDTPAMKVENMRYILNAINSNPTFAKRIIRDDAELLYICGGDLESLKTHLTKEIAIASEAFGKDLWWDGLIEAILNRKKHTTEYLIPTISECLDRVKKASNEMFGQWRAFKQISIFAKYLPDQKDWGKCVKSLTNAVNYLKTTKPEKFDQEKFSKFFTGTPYRKFDGQKVNTSTTNPGTTKTGLFTEDIRIRGWTERKMFIDALNDAQKLCKMMNELTSSVEKMKANGLDKTAKEYMYWVKETIDLMGHLGRGITTASKKIGGSVWARLFPGFNGENT